MIQGFTFDYLPNGGVIIRAICEGGNLQFGVYDYLGKPQHCTAKECAKLVKQKGWK